MQSDELSLRVGQLGSAESRSRLGGALRGAIQLANAHHAPLVTTRLRCAEIQENEELLLTLVDRLHKSVPLGIQGIAITHRLVHDRSSPLYRSHTGGSLHATASEALVALERGHRTAGRIGQ